MKYKEFGDRTHPTVVLLHGAGLSWWSFMDIIPFLKAEYHIVTPVIDGHGEDGATPFVSIQDSAQKLVQYIDANFQGKVLALCGLSLGGQIALEVLAKRADIATYAMVESAVVVPLKHSIRLMGIVYRLSYGLNRQRWFAKMRARTLCVQAKLFEQYYRDNINMSRDSLVNIVRSHIAYAVPDTLKNTKASMLIIVGSEEIRMMDRSVRKLMDMLPQAQVCVMPGMKHGELSPEHCAEYLALAHHFMA